MSLEAEVHARLPGFTLDLQLVVAAGETVAVLGPNGAGKTALLRVLAGLLPLDRGKVSLDQLTLEEPARGIRLEPERRPIGFVFQDYLLFPHLSVLDNVAFGLRSRGTAAASATSRARGWLQRVGVADLAGKKPAQLSGGQQQRVALARALATEPALLLLDEPMAALDASSRISLRRELRRQLREYRGVRIVVTHDPVEAMTVADRLVVIENGRVLQSGSAGEVSQRPRSRYVADLVGVNLFHGRASGNVISLAEGGTLTVAGVDDGDVFAIVHPRRVALYRHRPDGTPRNVWEARAIDVDLLGDRARVRLAGRPPIIAEVTLAAVRELGLDHGETVWVAIKATEVEVYAA